MESESEDVNNLKVGDEMSESNADDNKTGSLSRLKY